MSSRSLLMASILIHGVAACGPSAEHAKAAPKAPPGVEADASINELMALHMDPAADVIWELVQTVSNESGVQHYRPTTDVEWKSLEDRAHLIIAISEMLKTERPLAAPGVTITPGTLSPDEIQKTIAANQVRFAGNASALGKAGSDLLEAIRAKDADQVEVFGGELFEACESCHRSFYYPDKSPLSAAPR